MADPITQPVNTLPTDSSPVVADTVLAVKAADGSIVRVAMSTIKTLFDIPTTAADVGAVAANQGSGNAGKFLVVGNDGIVVPVTMAVWQGGSY